MTSVSPKGPCLLIVEDDPSYRNILATKLGAEGFRVLTCEKVTDAIRMLVNQRFDCVILDINLSRGTGEDVIASMRKEKTGPNFKTPVLVTSGVLDPELVQRISKDVSGIYVKPVPFELLLIRIRDMLSRTATTPARSPADAGLLATTVTLIESALVRIGDRCPEAASDLGKALENLRRLSERK